MQVKQLEIKDILLIKPKVFEDDRGYIYESFNLKAFEKCTGIAPNFVQDNQSKSTRGVLRGLHYQVQPKAQGKLSLATHN